MFIINNKTAHVIVLKAMGLPNLRIFPGHNSVKEKDLEAYTDGNAAAKSQLENNITRVDDSGITHEMRIEAEAAKEKNEMLNKSAVALKAANKKIDKSEKVITDQAKQLDEQSEKIEDQAKQLDEQGKMMVQLQDQLAELKAAIADPGLADEDKNKKVKK